jgi:hypothetical protein
MGSARAADQFCKKHGQAFGFRFLGEFFLMHDDLYSQSYAETEEWDDKIQSYFEIRSQKRRSESNQT